MHKSILWVACGILLLLPGRSSGQSPRPSIMIFYPTYSGSLQLDDRGLMQHAWIELQKLFPCAQIKNEADITDMLRVLKARSLFSQSENDLQTIMGEYQTDYACFISCSSNNGKISISMTLINLRKEKVAARSFAEDATGYETVVKAADKLYADQICPWKGKIKYTERTVFDTVPHYEGVDETHARDLENDLREWTIDRKAFLSKADLKVKRHKFSSWQQIQHGDFRCFKTKDGVTTDEEMLASSTKTDETTELEEIDLRREITTKTTVDFDFDQGTYTLQMPLNIVIARVKTKTTSKSIDACDTKIDNKQDEGDLGVGATFFSQPAKGKPGDTNLHGDQKWKDGLTEYELSWDLKK